MEEIFYVRLNSELDQPRLDRFRKLLNLTPEGRLEDAQDSEFGHRALRDVRDEWVWLDLSLSMGWTISLTFAGPRPPRAVVTACLAEILGAADALGLTVTRIWSSPQITVQAPTRLELPTHPALHARLIAAPDRHHQPFTTLRAALLLQGEVPTDYGNECGWRFVQRDDTNHALLQLHGQDSEYSVFELVLYYDRELPSPAVLQGCRLQIMAAASMAQMTIDLLEPPAPAGTPSFEDLQYQAHGVENIQQLWERFRAWDEPKQYKYGLLLTALAADVHDANQFGVIIGLERILPREGVVPDELRSQAEDFMLTVDE